MIAKAKQAGVALLAGLMVLMLVMGPASAVRAADAAAPQMTFPDVKSGHWAEKSITKLLLLGAVHGIDDKHFNPDGPVTKEQAVIMAVSLIGKASQVDTNKDYALRLMADKYARGYLDLAIKQGLIDVDEELGSIVSGGSQPIWGTSPASREWVAKLIVRAIGKDADAQAAGNQYTGFNDDAKIDAAYKGYVKLAADLKIVNGMEDGSFSPTSSVTRAQIAVMMAAAEPYSATHAPNLVSGTITAINATSLVLQDASGVLHSFAIAPTGVFYKNDSNAKITAYDIQPNTPATVIFQGSTAYYVETTGAAAQVQLTTVTGVLKTVSDQLNLTVTVDGTDKVFAYAANVSVINQLGGGMRLSELLPGSTVELQVNTSAATPTVQQIKVVAAAPVVATVQGTIASLDAAASTVTVSDSATQLTHSYAIPSGVAMADHGTAIAFADLHVGDTVKVVTTDNVVTSFERLQSSIVTVKGKVELVQDNRLYITKADNNAHIGYDVSSNVQITVSGMTQATLSDLQPGDDVSLELNDLSQVQKITVSNRNVDSGVGYSIYDYIEAAKKLILMKGTDVLDLTVTDNTALYNNDSIVQMSSFSTVFTKGKKVDVVYSGDRVVSLRISSSYTGTLQTINLTNNTITITTAELGDITLPFSYIPPVQMQGNSGATISNLHTGDKVNLLLDPNSNNLIAIQLYQNLVFTVKDRSYYNITVKDGSGSTYSFSVNYNTPVTKYNDQLTTMNDISIGDVVVLNLVGSTLKSITVPKVWDGTVTTVDTANSKLTLKTNDGSSKTFQFGSRAYFVKGTSSTNTLGSVHVNDRVRIVEEAATNNHRVSVVTAIQKTFFRYLPDSHSVEFYSYIGDTSQKVYPLDNNAYIHAGNTTLTIDSLANNDKVQIYVVDGKITEIERVGN